jgi:hypothetical protein
MSEGFIENPRYAHIPRPPSDPVWWLIERKEHISTRPNLIAVLARTWFMARAAGRVLLGTDEVDGDIAGDALLAEIDGSDALAGPHALFFVAVGGCQSTDLPAAQGCTLRAVATRQGVRDVASVDDENASGEEDLVLRDGAEHAAPTTDGEGQ